MRIGKINWFHANKGYGFIVPDDKSEDVFLHVSELKKIGLVDINPGQKVSFELENKKRKIAAIDIKLI